MRVPALPVVGGLLISALLGLLLPACDTVSNPFPPRESASAGRRDSLALDSAEAARPVPAPVQRVLLEDYTGHTCGNCPRAAKVAAALAAQYPGQVLVTATHVGFYAEPKADTMYAADYRTPAGDELNTDFGVDNFGLPQGMVNRTPAPGNTSPVASEGAWAGLVAGFVSQLPQQEIRLTPLLSANRDTIRLKLRTRYLTAQPGRTYRLVLNVLEDSIRSYQKDYSLNPSNIRNYTHRHLLRAAPLGTYGAVQVTAPAAGQEIVRYLSLPVAPGWNARHLSLIAYLLDDQSRRVVQVAEGHF